MSARSTWSGLVPGLKLDKLDVSAPKADQPVHVAFQGSFGNAPATLNGSVGIPPLLMSGGKLGGTVPIDWTQQALGSSLAVKGTAGEGPDGRPLRAGNGAVRQAGWRRAGCRVIGQAHPAPTANAAPWAAAPSPPPASANRRLIPDTPIPFDLLRIADADVTLNVGDMKWGGSLNHAISRRTSI